jgi:exosortase
MLGAVFWTDLRYLVHAWSTDANYSHGFLVPLLSVYFAHEALRRGPIAWRPGTALGFVLLVAALLGKLVTIALPLGLVAYLSLVLGLAGVCSLLAGRAALGRFGFAIAFLVFMVPLPVALYSAIASPLQLLVSKAASNLLNGLGIPVLRQGNTMTLPGGLVLFVAEACSGMRQLTGFLALTTACAYMSRRPLWYRGVLVTSSVPIAMTANVIRVIVTAFIMYFLNPKYASGTFHTLEGLAMMCLGLGLLAAECWVLGHWAAESESGAGPREPGPDPASLGPAPEGLSLSIRTTVGLALLACGLAAEAGVERATETTRPMLKRPLAELPLRIGDWVGQDTPVDPEVLERAQADDILSRVYEDRTRPGRRFAVWINYSRHGLNLRHSPEVCLPGQGYSKVEALCRTVPIGSPEHAPRPITLLGYARGELVQRLGFWYYIFGEGALERFVRSLPITSRSSHGRTTRGSGLTVEIFCPGDSDPDGEALREFAGALSDRLEPMLPDDRAHYFIP